MAKILMPEGSENINIGEPIAVVVEKKEDSPAFANATKETIDGDASAAPAPAPPTSAAQPAQSQPAQPVQPTQPVQPAQPAQPAQPTQTQPAQESRVFISPLAKSILKNSKSTLDVSSIKGSGPKGRVIAADVVAALAGSSAPVAAASTAAASAGPSYEDILVSNMRKVISTRLSESKQTIPHYYLNQNCYIDDLLKLRSRLNANLVQTNPNPDAKPSKITINDFIVKSCAMALRDVRAAVASEA